MLSAASALPSFRTTASQATDTAAASPGATVEAAEYKGGISGYDEDSKATYANNYYTSVTIGGVNGSDQDGARRARTVTLGEGIALSGTETTYNVSGITAYGSTAIGYGGKIYSGAGQTLTLNYTGTVPNGYTLSYTVTRTSNGSDITASVLSGTTLTMPAYDITVTATVSAIPEVGLTLNAATVLDETKYVGSFYSGTLHYQLPDGALAYTAGLDGTQVVFYRIGEDSRVIPTGTAVIIVADSASITLTKTTNPGITIASAKNILTGSDLPTAVTEGKVNGKTPYVLGVAGEPAALGFYKFTGDHIPAGKAYYLATE